MRPALTGPGGSCGLRGSLVPPPTGVTLAAPPRDGPPQRSRGTGHVSRTRPAAHGARGKLPVTEAAPPSCTAGSATAGKRRAPRPRTASPHRAPAPPMRRRSPPRPRLLRIRMAWKETRGDPEGDDRKRLLTSQNRRREAGGGEGHGRGGGSCATLSAQTGDAQTRAPGLTIHSVVMKTVI